NTTSAPPSASPRPRNIADRAGASYRERRPNPTHVGESPSMRSPTATMRRGRRVKRPSASGRPLVGLGSLPGNAARVWYVRYDPAEFAGRVARDVRHDFHIDRHARAEAGLQLSNQVSAIGGAEFGGRHDLHNNVIETVLNDLRLQYLNERFEWMGQNRRRNH